MNNFSVFSANIIILIITLNVVAKSSSLIVICPHGGTYSSVFCTVSNALCELRSMLVARLMK